MAELVAEIQPLGFVMTPLVFAKLLSPAEIEVVVAAVIAELVVKLVAEPPKPLLGLRLVEKRVEARVQAGLSELAV